jgi:DNA-binding LytR/AlgR family response regulator
VNDSVTVLRRRRRRRGRRHDPHGTRDRRHPRPLGGDGSEAIEILGAEDVDVVVLDIMMPKVDGWMALMEMRSNPETSELPVIMLTPRPRTSPRSSRSSRASSSTSPSRSTCRSCRPVSRASLSAGAMMGESSRQGEGDFRKLAVRKGGRTILLSIDDIVFLSARNKSTYAHTDENQYLVDLTLGELEEKLGRESFTRMHRSYMINLNRVREILRADGAYVVVASDRDETQIPVARRQVRAFREAVGI